MKREKFRRSVNLSPIIAGGRKRPRVSLHEVSHRTDGVVVVVVVTVIVAAVVAVVANYVDLFL